MKVARSLGTEHAIPTVGEVAMIATREQVLCQTELRDFVSLLRAANDNFETAAPKL
jgi:hypothetical protein